MFLPRMTEAWVIVENGNSAEMSSVKVRRRWRWHRVWMSVKISELTEILKTRAVAPLRLSMPYALGRQAIRSRKATFVKGGTS